MKNLSFSAIFLFAFLLFANSSSAQAPNKLTLEFAKGPVLQTRVPKSCDVVARVAYVGAGQNQPKPGWTVVFTLLSGPGPVPASGVSDANGLVRRKISLKSVIRAQMTNPSLLSAPLKCDAPPIHSSD